MCAAHALVTSHVPTRLTADPAELRRWDHQQGPETEPDTGTTRDVGERGRSARASRSRPRSRLDGVGGGDIDTDRDRLAAEHLEVRNDAVEVVGSGHGVRGRLLVLRHDVEAGDVGAFGGQSERRRAPDGSRSRRTGDPRDHILEAIPLVGHAAESSAPVVR